MKKALTRGPLKAVGLFGAGITLLCIIMFLFTACTQPVITQTTAPLEAETSAAETAASAPPVIKTAAATETAAATVTATAEAAITEAGPAHSPVTILNSPPLATPSFKPTISFIPRPSIIPKPSIGPTKPPVFSKIDGTWYSTDDINRCIVFYHDNMAYLFGIDMECTGYQFDALSMTGTMMADEGGGPYPYDFSITDGILNIFGETYSRTPLPFAAVVGTWYDSSHLEQSISFNENGELDYYGWAGVDGSYYSFDSGTNRGRLWLDLSGSLFFYDFSIADDKLQLAGGDAYTRVSPNADIAKRWYNTSNISIHVIFRTDGTAEFIGMDAECTGYTFNPNDHTGLLYINDGGTVIHPFSIVDGKLHLMGDIYERA